MTEVRAGEGRSMRQLHRHLAALELRHSPAAWQQEGRRVESLQDYFRGVGSMDPTKCYSSSYATFTARYLLRNVVKDLHLVRRLHALGVLQQCHRIVDIGSGPGTFALALLLWLHGSRSCATNGVGIEVVMVEPVPEFLDVAQSIWAGFGPTAAPVRPTFLRQFVRGELSPFVEGADLIVFSNSLAEVLRNPAVNSERLLHSIQMSTCAVAMLDHEYEGLQGLFSRFAHAMHRTHTRLGSGSERHADHRVLSLHSHAPRQHLAGSLHESVKPRRPYVESVWVPTESDQWHDLVVGHELLAAYQVAWETHDVTTLQSLFTDDAVYVEKEEEEPLEGIREIIDYWRFEAERQGSVRFRPTQAWSHGGELAANWQCTLFRTDLSRWLYLAGQLTAVLDGRRIRLFRESFQKQTIG